MKIDCINLLRAWWNGMAKIEPSKEVFCFQITKKHGRPCGYGIIQFGKSVYGEYDPLAGVYKRHRTSKGVVWSRNRYWVQPNADTVAQQTQRTKFGNAVAGWQALTSEQKAVYNNARKKHSLTGFCYYIKQFMLDRI
jgi:hypothetical protein